VSLYFDSMSLNIDRLIYFVFGRLRGPEGCLSGKPDADFDVCLGCNDGVFWFHRQPSMESYRAIKLHHQGHGQGRHVGPHTRDGRSPNLSSRKESVRRTSRISRISPKKSGHPHDRVFSSFGEVCGADVQEKAIERFGAVSRRLDIEAARRERDRKCRPHSRQARVTADLP
jgi:hypothetical protein